MPQNVKYTEGHNQFTTRSLPNVTVDEINLPETDLCVNSIALQSPDGTKYKFTVSDSGQLIRVDSSGGNGTPVNPPPPSPTPGVNYKASWERDSHENPGNSYFRANSTISGLLNGNSSWFVGIKIDDLPSIPNFPYRTGMGLLSTPSNFVGFLNTSSRGSYSPSFGGQTRPDPIQFLNPGYNVGSSGWWFFVYTQGSGIDVYSPTGKINTNYRRVDFVNSDGLLHIGKGLSIAQTSTNIFGPIYELNGGTSVSAVVAGVGSVNPSSRLIEEVNNTQLGISTFSSDFQQFIDNAWTFSNGVAVTEKGSVNMDLIDVDNDIYFTRI